ncbi:hypothetical protein L1049_025281 [Liquidambar formosana]|uniref:A-kinase anchor protein 7-like phosphoesterase domain-containing protein n=1 Tax=Liquidambar formosana TaxID=63359 RepID=A0AAP0N595_LIQFO
MRLASDLWLQLNAIIRMAVTNKRTEGRTRRCSFPPNNKKEEERHTNDCLQASPLQGCHSHNGLSYKAYNRKMSGAENTQSAVDRKKKRKTVYPVWRPVCTQASSYEECLARDVKVVPEDGSHVEEVHASISSCVSSVQHVKMEAEAVNEITDSTISSRPLQDNDEDRALEGGSMLSAENHSISLEAVKSPNLDYSHFVSLPLAIHPELVDKLVNFQNFILGNSDPNPDENLESDSNKDTSDDEDKDQQKGLDVAVEDNPERVKVDKTNIRLTHYPPKASKSSTLSDLGIDRSIFIKPKTFHLTVLMLKLWNKDRVNAATEVLKSVSSRVMDALDSRPLSVKLKGLDCMRGSLANARVLYAPVEEVGSEDRLLQACQVITDAYIEAGLVLEKDAKQKLKLHATVMNARHRKRKKWTRKFDSFDARGIVKQYGSEEWGEYLIREAHLSQRFVFDDNGYYHCCASIPFPENMQLD